MSKDITYVPPDCIAKHTKTNNIISCDKEGNIVFDIETEYIPLIYCKECTHYKEPIVENGREFVGWHCELDDYERKPYDFCSQSEKKWD